MEIAKLKSEMTNKIQEILWRQFGAGIDMLINLISSCPEHFLSDNKRFYYLAYHSIVFLDYYSSIPPDSFEPVLPFTMLSPEQRPAESIGDMIPDRIYTRQELLGYLKNIRLKCNKLIINPTIEEYVDLRFTEGQEQDDMDYPLFEILLYNLRHTQHHVGQLNLIIRQESDTHMEWIFQADK
mgnify:CR=1 FL=1